MPSTSKFTGTLTPFAVAYRPKENSPWKPFGLPTDNQELCHQIAQRLAALIRYPVAVLRNGQPAPGMKFDPQGVLHPAELRGIIREQVLRGQPSDGPETEEVMNQKHKLSIKDDDWPTIRTAVIKRLAKMVHREKPIGGIPDQLILDLLPKAAAAVVDHPQMFSQLRTAQVDWIMVDTRKEVNRIRMPYTAAKEDRRHLTEQLEQRGALVKVLPTGAKPRITVTTIDGRPVAIPPQGIAAVNMGDDEEAYQKEVRYVSATATAPVTEKAAKIFPDCLCGCGNKTNGGRFLPGHDAKLKSRLVKEFRSDDEQVSASARQELENLNWGQYATPAPVKKPKGPGRATMMALGKGNFEVRDEEGTLLQRTANDEAAMEWADANGFEVVSTSEGFMNVAKIDPEEDEEEDDSEEEDDDQE